MDSGHGREHTGNACSRTVPTGNGTDGGAHWCMPARRALPPIRTLTVGPGISPGQPATGRGRVADCNRRFGLSPTPECAATGTQPVCHGRRAAMRASCCVLAHRAAQRGVRHPSRASTPLPDNWLGAGTYLLTGSRRAPYCLRDPRGESCPRARPASGGTPGGGLSALARRRVQGLPKTAPEPRPSASRPPARRAGDQRAPPGRRIQQCPGAGRRRMPPGPGPRARTRCRTPAGSSVRRRAPTRGPASGRAGPIGCAVAGGCHKSRGPPVLRGERCPGRGTGTGWRRADGR